MCEFCNSNPETILDTTYDITQANCDTQNGTPTVGTLIMIDDEAKTIDIDFGVNKINFIRETLHIKYCPMCGREL